jgi:hypothetical protein
MNVDDSKYPLLVSYRSKSRLTYRFLSSHSVNSLGTTMVNLVNLGAVEAILGENLTKWLLRLVVTLLIAAVWDYCCRPPPPAKTQTRPNSSTDTATTVSGDSTHPTALPANSRLLHDLDSGVLDELALEETVEAFVKEKQEVAKEEEIIPATEKQEKTPAQKETEASNSGSSNNSNSNIKEDEEKRLRAGPTSSIPSSSSPSLQRQPTPSPPVFRATTDDHPGLQAFWDWCNVETSLFRIYTVGRTDHVPVVPPYNPSSRRGQVSVHLRVTNGTDMTITVYWVNYKGREERKGNIRPGAVWTQTTWMEHPWVFREAAHISDDGTTDEQRVLLHYIPYTILPTLPESPTVDPEDPTVGMHQFTIRPLYTTTSPNPYSISIDDPTLPFPAEHGFNTPTACISWTLMHCRRMMEAQLLDISMYTTLIKYLTKIVQHPEVPKYRQIRIANPVFHRLWQSPVRGLLLAVGFVECGAYLELGSSASSGSGSSPLRRDRVQDAALLLFQVEQSQLLTLTGNANTAVTRQQPLGADGFGRAGWGRAGDMNMPDS